MITDTYPITEDTETPGAIYSSDAEQAVLGSVLISPEILVEVSDLYLNDFFIHKHRYVWKAIKHLHDCNVQIDILTVTDELARVGVLDECGGPAFLTALVNRVPNSYNAPSYAEIVRDRAARRKMIADANQAARDAYDLDKPLQATEAPGNRFTVTWADRVYEESPPLEFLVHGLLTKGSVNLLVGEGGSKKTWAALDLAVCVAIGDKWLDFETRQAPVLIVDEESGPRRLRRRLYETLNGHLIKRENVPPIAFTSLQQLDMRQPDDVNALQMAIRESGAGLVIIDALADIMPGADENAVKDVQPIFLQLRSVAEATQAAIVIIHHSNKQNGYRGSTAIKGAIDLMLMVDSSPESKYVSFAAEKARDIEQVKFTAVATWVKEPPQFYLSATDLNPKVHLNKAQRYVLRYLLEHGNSVLDEVTADPDTCAPRTAKNSVYSLMESGHIERTNSGTGRGVRAEIDLTAKGRELADSL